MVLGYALMKLTSDDDTRNNTATRTNVQNPPNKIYLSSSVPTLALTPAPTPSQVKSLSNL